MHRVDDATRAAHVEKAILAMASSRVTSPTSVKGDLMLYFGFTMFLGGAGDDVKALGKTRAGLSPGEGSTKRRSASILMALGKNASKLLVSNAADAGFIRAHISMVPSSTASRLEGRLMRRRLGPYRR